MASVLLEKQWKFSQMAAQLILKAKELGYEVSLGDAMRDQRVFGAFGEKKGYGEAKSQHKRRLAINLMLFKDGKYLTATEDYKPLGLWWESIGGAWGGRFSDGNHFSLEHEGYK